MRKEIKILVFLIGLIPVSFTVRSQCRLEIEITDFRNSKGALMLQLMDEHQHIVAQEKKVIQDKKCVVLIGELKPGRYGVRFYHDENLSGKLETNLFGKPKEGYGFSNNARAEFGPPSFDKWLFDLVSDKKITLKPIY